MLNCQLCINENGDSASNSTTFPSLDQLEAHLAADHFSLLPYECEHCQFAKFPTEFAVMQHNEIDHDCRSYSFRCRITPEVKEKRRKMKEFLLKVADKKALKTEKFNGRNDEKLAEGSQYELRSKRKASERQRKNDQNKMNGEEKQEEEEKPKRICRRPRPFSLNGYMETNSECANERAAVSLPIEGEWEDDETEADNEGSSLLTSKLKEQQADVQEILRATAVAISQFGGPKRLKTPPIKQRSAETPPIKRSAETPPVKHRSADDSYSLRPKRFTPYAMLHNGIPIPTEEDIDYQTVENSRESSPSPSKNGQKRSKSKTVEQIQCRKCKEMVNASGGCLSHHTNARHLRLPMFHCKGCKKDFFEVSNSGILKHIRDHHDGNAAKYLVNNYHKFSSILHSTRDECFGEKGGRTNNLRNEVAKSNKKGTSKSAEEKQSAKVTKGQTEEGANDLVSCTERHSAELQRSNRLSQEQNFPKNNDNLRVRCKICGEMVWNQTANRLNHVNVRHLQLPLHQCAVCNKSFTSYSRSACHTHVQFAHKAEMVSGKCSRVVEEHIIYRKETYDGQLMKAAKECF